MTLGIETLILIIHVFIAIALIAVVLLQRSEGGGLGIGGGGGGMGNFMSARGTANLLTRITGVLAACFFATSVSLALLSGVHGQQSSILDVVDEQIRQEDALLPSVPVDSDPVAPQASEGSSDQSSDIAVPTDVIDDAADVVNELNSDMPASAPVVPDSE